MKVNIYRIIGFFAVLTICVLGSHTAKAYAYDYTIDAYDINIRVMEDNTYHIEEKISTTFNIDKHGIYRSIPEVNYIRRADGSTSTVIAQVKNIKVSSDAPDEFESERDGNNRKIKIGDADRTVTGSFTYNISYDYIYGKDRLEGADEFYMNLIGTEWDTTISNVTFTITMPKAFDEKKFGMAYGYYGSEEYEGIYYSLEGNTIRGELRDIILQPGEALTTRIELEEGYYTETESFPVVAVIALVLCCLFLLISFIIWMAKGKDDEVIDVLEFYPPDRLNCAEIAYIYKGSVLNTDVVPMIITLAEKGFLEIEQSDAKGKKFKLHILKQYDGDDEAERLFMFGLAQYGTTITKSELEDSFYKTIALIVSHIDKNMKSKVFFTDTLVLRYITFPLALIPYLVGLYQVFKLYTGEFLFAIGYPVIGFLFISVMTCIIGSKTVKILGKCVAAIISFIGLWFYITMGAYPISYSGSIYWVVLLACIVANILQMIFYMIIDKRTEYGIEMLGRVRGFKRYLETAEKDHLISLVDQDPKYFYKILPYTYVLDITDKWTKQFEGIEMQQPDWYRGYGGSYFDYYMFNSFMNRTMTSATSAMTSTPGSSGGGSGGGFSGGGGGGGGGGSW